MIIHNMLISLVASEQCDVDDDEDIICELYEGNLDGACGDGEEDGSECVEGGRVAAKGEMESIEIETTSFLEILMIKEFIIQRITGFDSLKRDFL